MNNRERVLATLAHEKTDRVALDLSGMDTTMTINAYQRFKGFYGITTPTIVKSERWQTVDVDEEVLLKYDIDLRHIQPYCNADATLLKKGIIAKRDDNKFLDEWHVERQVVGDYANITHSPLQFATSIAELDAFDWPENPEEDYPCEGLREKAKALYDAKEYAICGQMGNACSLFEQSWYLRGLSEYFMDLAINQDFAHHLMRKVTDIRKRNMKNYLTQVGEYLDIYQIGDDLASQSSLLISRDMYVEMIKPYHIELIEYAKQFTKAAIYFHSCGAVEPLLDELIDCGVSVLNPVQVSAAGMDSAFLKKRYGDKITFYGGIDTLEILSRGTTEDVRNEVIKRVNDFAVNGGYILSSVHNIQSDVPPENIDVMFKTAVSIPVK